MNNTAYSSLRKGYFILIIPGLLLLLTFYAYPVLSAFHMSMTDWDGVSRTSEFIGFENYISALSDSRFMNSLSFTVKYALVSTVLSNIIALAVALALVQKIKFRNIFRAVFFFPAVLSMLIIGYIWKQIYYHVIPYLGERLNVEALQTNMLGNHDLVFWALILVTVWQASAILVVIYMAGLQTIPDDVYESAAIDGASGMRKFFRITLPLIVPSITICTILAMKQHLMVYDYIIALTDGGPGFATESVTLLIYNLGFLNNNYGYGSAVALILFLFIIIVSIIQISILRKREVQL
ncbi:carbohydrate ABC transporter permease [Alteribacillus bidgolensis]|uniref:Raffinose/stachyose/melibiose transport system permease protein n=1 Tax=Alteribacillus bidgolensis TaxID=930129 RepID=A0A1G8GX32_9BACI|nr:sugar ABC transporter permease [Alteribacillus bidgolensis]SDH98965.1 raffinose/stachyose/melibiose transport system permease protein [Alteribacillus bidgolensis]